jgi:hypothetical protein
MFPKLHQRSSLASPHWNDSSRPAPKPGSRPRIGSQPGSQPLPPLGIDEAIQALDDAFDQLPEAALRACQADRALAIPRLIDVLERTVQRGQEGAAPEGNATIYALFLLAEFKAIEAVPAVWRFLKLPHDIPEQLLGDAITEDLPRLLAIFAGPRLDLLDELILNPAHNQWVRSAALGACTYLVRDGLLSRENVAAWLKTHLTEAIRRRDESITDSLICNLLNLNANEARAEIERAFQEGLVDESMVTLKSVNEELRPDADAGECNRPPHHTPTEIADTVEELRHWNWQAEKSKDVEAEDANNDWGVGWSAGPQLFESDAEPGVHLPTTVRHERPRVGRNDPCPCGSGRKVQKMLPPRPQRLDSSGRGR